MSFELDFIEAYMLLYLLDNYIDYINNLFFCL